MLLVDNEDLPLVDDRLVVSISLASLVHEFLGAIVFHYLVHCFNKQYISKGKATAARNHRKGLEEVRGGEATSKVENV